ncbi:MAG: flagellar biosynthetic protein FliO [Treponema sp.]|nr:flagellar biosynthetic protein FliO [Treponema sp.]
MPARVLCTALFVWIFVFSVTNISAQSDLSGDRPEEPAIETQAPIETPDPIKTAEQSLTLGSGDVGAAMPGSAVSVFSIFRILLTLAVVAAAIYGLVYFLKFRRASRDKVEQDPFLKILASVPLGASRGVHVISVGQQAWLVGSAETGVNLISEITDKDTINAMLLEDSRRIAAPPIGGAGPLLDFKAILGRLGISAKNESAGPDQIRKRSERLKGL